MAATPEPAREQPTTVDATKARQGYRGRHALWILLISLGLIAVIYAVMVVGVQGTHLTTTGGQTTVDQKALQGSGGYNMPAPKARQNEQSPTTSSAPPSSQGK